MKSASHAAAPRVGLPAVAETRASSTRRHRASTGVGSQFADFAELHEALRRGHPYAYQAVYEQFATRVQAFAAARGVEDPAALANDVMLVVFESSDRFRGSESNFTSWVFRIARNKIVDDRRRQTRRPVSASDDSQLGLMRAVNADPAALVFDPADVDRLLDELSAPQREVIVLRILTGLSNAEVAKVIGKREGAVRALYHRGMAVLRDRLTS